MKGRGYELRLHVTDGCASAEVVEVVNGKHTVMGRYSTTSTVPISFLQFKPIGRKSWLGRLKPTRMKVNLWFVGAEWDFTKQ